MKRSSSIALQWSQLSVQCGRRTSKSGLTALLGEVEVPTSRPFGFESFGKCNDIVPLVLLLLMFAIFLWHRLFKSTDDDDQSEKNFTSTSGLHWQLVNNVLPFATTSIYVENVQFCAEIDVFAPVPLLLILVQSSFRSPVRLCFSKKL